MVASKGRAKGGIILAIKESKDRQVVEWKRGESKEVIGVRVNGGKERWLIVVVYMNKDKERNFELIKK